MSERLLPMLAVAGKPFDSPEYLFEVKWDGVRALAADGPGGWVLWGRGGADYTSRYPELACLARLPAGTVLDGELIRLGPAGVPSLAALLRRHQLLHPERVAAAARAAPVTYVAFDLLALAGRSLVAEPLHTRRAALQELLADLGEPGLVFSPGVVGAGRAFFDLVVAGGHEGIVAKHQASRYRPGRRSATWVKVKPARRRRSLSSGAKP
jgi:bifunctional non-homologous end joining protein LigD